MATSAQARLDGPELPRRRWARRRLSARGRSLEITRAGWLFILLTLAVGFTAINSGSNLLHAIFGAQMALIIGSGLLSESVVRRCSAERMCFSEIFAGQSAPVQVVVRNIDRTGTVLSVSVEDDDRAASKGVCTPVFAVRIPPEARATFAAQVTMPRRGYHSMVPAVIATRFPFGLFVKRRQLPSRGQLLVYPAIDTDLRVSARSTRVHEGEVAQQRARTGEFYGLREYRQGDDLRQVHWPAAARTGRVFVRESEAVASRELILDLSLGVRDDPAFEHEVQSCASAAVRWLNDGNTAVGLRVDGHVEIQPGFGAHHRRALLEYLALCGREPTP